MSEGGKNAKQIANNSQLMAMVNDACDDDDGDGDDEDGDDEDGDDEDGDDEDGDGLMGMVMMRLITTHDEDSLFEDSRNTACKVGCRSEILIITMISMVGCICQKFWWQWRSDLDRGRKIDSRKIICIHLICLHFTKSASNIY